MLTALRITDFATVEEAELTLGPGLTVLTGETGAGKSLLVDALCLLLGSRGDAGWVRAGASEASVEGLFARTPLLGQRLESLGLPDLGEEVSIRRVIQTSGRGKVHVNGALATVGVLAQLTHGLFDVAGQMDQVGLFSPGEHRSLLDRAGKVDSEQLTYGIAYARLREIDAHRAALGGDDAQFQARTDFLAFQLGEIEELNLEAGEGERLENERRRLSGTARIQRAAEDTENLLRNEEGAALDRVVQASSLLKDAGAIDPALAPLAARLAIAGAELEDIASSIARHLRGVEAQPDRLAEVEDRIAILKRLCRKHATDPSGLSTKKSALAEELESLSHRQEARERLEGERAQASQTAWLAARELSSARMKAAGVLAKAVTRVLASLAMPNARFEVEVKPKDTLGEEGADEVQFVFSANAGEPLRPLAKVASGGEASRLLLALRQHLMASDDGFGCVLDEADAGVNGAVADVVGQLMKKVSLGRQVLCITHLPQVAAYGDAHWVVEKHEEKGRTRSRVKLLPDEGTRVLEVARMLSGRQVTEEARKAALALVKATARVHGRKNGALPKSLGA